MNKWLSNLEFRNIKDVKIKKYFDKYDVEFRKIELIDSNGDVHIIIVRMDGK